MHDQTMPPEHVNTAMSPMQWHLVIDKESNQKHIVYNGLIGPGSGGVQTAIPAAIYRLGTITRESGASCASMVVLDHIALVNTRADDLAHTVCPGHRVFQRS